ncbi:MAG: Na(+)-translocating NADH-quinone reductase subunit A [Flavobacteriaceae bacterium]
MSADIKIRNGFDLNLNGEANKILSESERSNTYALKPTDFFYLKPKLLVNEGDKVKKGTPLFFSKNNPRIHFVSPVAGEILAISRGEKRKILEVVISSENNNNDSVKFKTTNFKNFSVDEIKDILLRSGSWPFILQRPYGIIAQPEDKPKAIYISTYSTSPLDVDFDFILKNKKDDFQLGLSVLSKLADTVYLTVDSNFPGFFKNIKGASILNVKGPHPAGNVGVQIHNYKPISPGEKVWTVKPEDVSNIGYLFKNGEFCSDRTLAVVGPTVKNPQYFTSIIGASISSILKKIEVDKSKECRLINGDVYSGKTTNIDGYVSYSNNLLTIIPEGKNYRMFGWLPFKDNFIPSMSKTSFSRFLNKRKLEVTTNLNGEERAIVVTGEMEKVFPMDIFPMQLVKACLNQDIERMEALGIYEVVPEDFGLIDFSSSSKIEAQEIIKKGIELIINEES